MQDWLSALSIKTGNQWVDFNVNALILSAVIILVPVLIAFIIPLFEKKKGKLRSTLFLYAFSTGFFIVLGLFGEANEGRELAADAASHVDPNNSLLSIGYQILVLVLGSFIGLGAALGFKYFINKKWGKFNLNFPIEEHSDHDAFHNHPHAHELLFARPNNLDTKSYNKAKTTALYLILFHRFAAGLFLGYTIYNLVASNYANTPVTYHAPESSINLAFLIGFFLHLVPEEAIIYYRQREMGIKKSKSILNSILMILLLIPFIFLGANLGTFVSELWILNGTIHVIVGVMFMFTALVEFFPEVIRESTTQKKWYLTILWLIIGVVVCFVLISFEG